MSGKDSHGIKGQVNPIKKTLGDTDHPHSGFDGPADGGQEIIPPCIDAACAIAFKDDALVAALDRVVDDVRFESRRDRKCHDFFFHLAFNTESSHIPSVGEVLFDAVFVKKENRCFIDAFKGIEIAGKDLFAAVAFDDLIAKGDKTPGRPLDAMVKASSKLLRASELDSDSGTCEPVRTTGFPRFTSM